MSFAYSERRRLLDRALADQAGIIRGIVVEIGAGRKRRRGHFTPPIEQTVRWWSLDLAPKVGPHIIGDAEALPLRSASIDTVVSLEVLEYVKRPETALADMYRVLRPGGHLLLSVPFVHRIDAPSDRWRFSEFALREILAAVGFEVVALRAQGYILAAIAHLVWSAIAQMPRRIERWLLGTLGLPLVALARLERLLVREDGPFASATTGYIVLGRK